MKPDELERPFAQGESILEAGAAARELYVVRSGEIRIEVGDTQQVLVQGDVFGECGGLLGRPSVASATALTDASVLVVDPELLEELLRDSPEFSVRLVRHLASQLHRFASAVPGQDLPAGMGTLVKTLLARAEHQEPPCPVTGGLRDIAAAAGVSMRDAYDSIQLLLERRVLRLVDDRLSIVDPDQLEQL